MCNHMWDEALGEEVSGGVYSRHSRKIVPCALCGSLKVTFFLRERDGSSTERVEVLESGWYPDRRGGGFTAQRPVG